MVVEGLAGLLLTLGAFATLTRKTWAWAAATWGYAVALAGVRWGMVAIAAGRGPHTQLNDTFHRVMALLLAGGLILLLRPMGRASFGWKRSATSDDPARFAERTQTAAGCLICRPQKSRTPRTNQLKGVATVMLMGCS